MATPAIVLPQAGCPKPAVPVPPVPPVELAVPPVPVVPPVELAVPPVPVVPPAPVVPPVPSGAEPPVPVVPVLLLPHPWKTKTWAKSAIVPQNGAIRFIVVIDPLAGWCI